MRRLSFPLAQPCAHEAQQWRLPSPSPFSTLRACPHQRLENGGRRAGLALRRRTVCVPGAASLTRPLAWERTRCGSGRLQQQRSGFGPGVEARGPDRPLSRPAPHLQVLHSDIDLLNPPAELEKLKHKRKRLVQSPNSVGAGVEGWAAPGQAVRGLWVVAYEAKPERVATRLWGMAAAAGCAHVGC